VYAYAMLYLACHFGCEIMMIDPMDVKIDMLKLDILRDLLVLILDF
jgi:hypothetical protein